MLMNFEPPLDNPGYLLIKLQLIYNRIKHFIDFNNDPVVCGMPNLIELCYSLAYKENISI